MSTMQTKHGLRWLVIAAADGGDAGVDRFGGGRVTLQHGGVGAAPGSICTRSLTSWT